MENKLNKPDPSNSSFNCSREEAAVYGGCRRYSDGIYRSLPRKGEYTLADGLRLLGVHSMADSADCAEVYLFMTGGPDTEERELFYLTDREKEALPCSRPLTRRMMHPICTAVLPSFPQHTAKGRTLCIDCWEPSADTPGTLHLRWDGADRGYTVVTEDNNTAEDNDTSAEDNVTSAEDNVTTAEDVDGLSKAAPHTVAHPLIHRPQDIAGTYTHTHTYRYRCRDRGRKPVCVHGALRKSRILCHIRPDAVHQLRPPPPHFFLT